MASAAAKKCYGGKSSVTNPPLMNTQILLIGFKNKLISNEYR